jgi:hypothetical protein
MAQTIKLKRSATQGATPATSALELGEVAINTYDGKMFIKKDDGTESIVDIANSGAFLPLSGGTLTGNVSTSGNVAFTAGASDWVFTVSGNDLVISYGGTNKAKLDTSGNLTVVGNVTAYGTI